MTSFFAKINEEKPCSRCVKPITYIQARPISKPDNTHNWKNEQSLLQTSNFCHCTIFPFFRALCHDGTED